jgi:hypothetical protein
MGAAPSRRLVLLVGIAPSQSRDRFRWQLTEEAAHLFLTDRNLNHV